MMIPESKQLTWVGSSRNDLRNFPPDARHRAGQELRLVQRGLTPLDWKPMRTVGPGANEIRIHTVTEHRVIYVARFGETIYVLHAFEKRTGKTARRDIELARRRYAAVFQERRKRGTGG